MSEGGVEDSPIQNPEKAERARVAQGRLESFYAPDHKFGYHVSKAQRNLNVAVDRYRMSLLHAQAEGMDDQRAREYVKQELIDKKIITSENPESAEMHFVVISEGYDMNKDYWDQRLDRLLAGVR